jgi:hypothetical protein
VPFSRYNEPLHSFATEQKPGSELPRPSGRGSSLLENKCRVSYGTLACNIQPGQFKDRNGKTRMGWSRRDTSIRLPGQNPATPCSSTSGSRWSIKRPPSRRRSPGVLRSHLRSMRIHQGSSPLPRALATRSSPCGSTCGRSRYLTRRSSSNPLSRNSPSSRAKNSGQGTYGARRCGPSRKRTTG